MAARVIGVRCIVACGAGLGLAMAPAMLSARAWAAQPRPHTYPLPCLYADRGSEMVDLPTCAAKTATGFAIAPAVLAKMAYPHGLGTLVVRGVGWFYCRRDGINLLMMTFDNGPDYFAENYARAMIAGKLAYVDRRLRVRVRTHYDWGDQFGKGRADVCIGCALTPIDNGEHSFVTGGRWGVIDHAGHEIVPVPPTAIGHASPPGAPN